MSNASLQRVRRANARRDGKCIYCFVMDADPERTSCQPCRDRIGRWVKKNRAAKKAARCKTTRVAPTPIRTGIYLSA